MGYFTTTKWLIIAFFVCFCFAQQHLICQKFCLKSINCATFNKWHVVLHCKRIPTVCLFIYLYINIYIFSLYSFWTVNYCGINQSWTYPFLLCLYIYIYIYIYILPFYTFYLYTFLMNYMITYYSHNSNKLFIINWFSLFFLYHLYIRPF